VNEIPDRIKLETNDSKMINKEKINSFQHNIYKQKDGVQMLVKQEGVDPQSREKGEESLEEEFSQDQEQGYDVNQEQGAERDQEDFSEHISHDEYYEHNERYADQDENRGDDIIAEQEGNEGQELQINPNDNTEKAKNTPTSVNNNFNKFMEKKFEIARETQEPQPYNNSQAQNFGNELNLNFNAYNNYNSNPDNQTNYKNFPKKENRNVEMDLYNDAAKRKEKMEKLDYNNMMEILINSSKHKISNKSYQIALNKVEKNIDSSFSIVIKEHNSGNEINFFQLGEILTHLTIFRETFEINSQNQSQKSKMGSKNSIQNYKNINLELKKTKKSEARKRSEIQFLEQLWMLINPENTKAIRADTIKEFLKILFSPLSASPKEISDILVKFIQATNFLNTKNLNQEKVLISPLSLKQVDERELWTVENIVKEFLNLKENLLAYKGIKNIKPTSAVIADSKRKDFSFKPKILNTKNDSLLNTKFEDRLKKFQEAKKENITKKTKEYEESKIRECTFKPDIQQSKKRYEFEEDSQDEKFYDRLHNNYLKKLQDIEMEQDRNKERMELKELESCTFKPHLNTLTKEVFENKLTEKEAKIYEQTVERMRNGILENFKKKYLSERVTTGENWEKVKKTKVKPFDITDLKPKNKENESQRNLSNDEYFSIQITIPNGKDRILRISRNDDPEEIASNFCKIYGLKPEIKSRLTKTINHFVNLYLKTEEEHSNTNNFDNEAEEESLQYNNNEDDNDF